METHNKLILVFAATMAGLLFAYLTAEVGSTKNKPEEVEQPVARVDKPAENPIVINSALSIYTVEIDGVEYLVADSQGGGISIIQKASWSVSFQNKPTPQPPVQEPPATPPAYP